jgi:hypothetical protein
MFLDIYMDIQAYRILYLGICLLYASSHHHTFTIRLPLGVMVTMSEPKNQSFQVRFDLRRGIVTTQGMSIQAGFVTTSGNFSPKATGFGSSRVVIFLRCMPYSSHS